MRVSAARVAFGYLACAVEDCCSQRQPGSLKVFVMNDSALGREPLSLTKLWHKNEEFGIEVAVSLMKDFHASSSAREEQ